MKKFKSILIFVAILIVVICLFFMENREGLVHRNLKKISQDERESLEFFFRSFFSDQFGYTLFGDKPIAVTGYFLNKKKFGNAEDLLDSFVSLCNSYNLRSYRGWQI